MGAAGQESLFDQVPHDKRRQCDRHQAHDKKDERIQFCKPESNQGLEYGPMDDVNAVGKIAVLRKIAKTTPEPENEYDPGDPKQVEDLTRKEAVREIQNDADASDRHEVQLQLVEIEQQQYARREIGELSRELNLQLRVETT